MLALLLLSAVPLTYDASADVTIAGGTLVGGFDGSFEVLTGRARLEHALGAYVAVGVPVAHLELGAYGFDGLGDVSAEAGWRIGDVRVGLSSMWPTGDPHRGLGTAHLMLAPVVAARHESDRLVLSAFAMLRGAVPLGEHGQHNHQSIISPHDVLDVAMTAALGTKLTSWLELDVLGAPVVTLIPHPVTPVGTRLALGAGAFAHVGLFRFGVQAMLPVTDNRTSSWQAGATIALGDGAAAPDACH